jgi:hypothetical protein
MYRGAKGKKRITDNTRHIQEQHGETATWRRYVSALTGVSVAGFGPTPYYAERLITALFYQDQALKEAQTEPGQSTNARFRVTVSEPLTAQDELVWRGFTFRIESESQPQRINNTYSYIIAKGQDT